MRIKDKRTIKEVIDNLIFISDMLESTSYRWADRNSVAQFKEGQIHLARCIEAFKLGKRHLEKADYNEQREKQRLDIEEQTNRGDN